MKRIRVSSRNKGRHSYSIRSKAEGADTYGTYTNGVQENQDRIDGHKLPLHQIWRKGLYK